MQYHNIHTVLSALLSLFQSFNMFLQKKLRELSYIIYYIYILLISVYMNDKTRVRAERKTGPSSVLGDEIFPQRATT